MAVSGLTRSTAEDARRCLAAFLLGYLLSEGGVSITALFGL